MTLLFDGLSTQNQASNQPKNHQTCNSNSGINSAITSTVNPLNRTLSQMSPHALNQENVNPLFNQEKASCFKLFDNWSEFEQTDFIQSLLSKMSHCQHSQINIYLKPMLQRDFISLLPSKLLVNIVYNCYLR